MAAATLFWRGFTFSIVHPLAERSGSGGIAIGSVVRRLSGRQFRAPVLVLVIFLDHRHPDHDQFIGHSVSQPAGHLIDDRLQRFKTADREQPASDVDNFPAVEARHRQANRFTILLASFPVVRLRLSAVISAGECIPLSAKLGMVLSHGSMTGR
jgi:hypothetical protein